MHIVLDKTIVLIRGAGEIASAVACTLQRCGFKVILTELADPLAIRRTVSFSDAVRMGQAEVEKIQARFAREQDLDQHFSKGVIPVLLDENIRIADMDLTVLVDARIQKKVQPDMRHLAPLTIGLGPGFTAQKNCHLVIETQRGHNLGKILEKGSAAADTGIPGDLGGETIRRVIRAPAAGTVEWQVDFGDLVTAEQELGCIGGQPVPSQLDGVVRGLIAPGSHVRKGMKIADVDPRGAAVDSYSISDKSRALGRAVLEAILADKSEGGIILKQVE